jgi:hypothetical protein
MTVRGLHDQIAGTDVLYDEVGRRAQDSIG